MAGIKVFNVGRMVRALERIEDRTSRRSREAVRKGVRDIRDLARKYAPVDEGNLEDAIVIEEEVRMSRNRLVMFVGVDESLLGPGFRKHGFRYDVEMHEGTYNLGPLSQEKARRLGVDVGRKYLQRALDEIRPEIEEKINKAVRDEMR